MTLVVLCSGQGLQHAGMFDLTGGSPAAEPLFARCAALLGGTDPRALVRTADLAALQRNRTGQLLCTLQALAAAAALGDALPARRIVAGYSVGEVAAWSLAGLFEPAEALRLAGLRAEAMDAAAQGDEGLLFVRGLDPARVDALCAEHGAFVSIVNPGDAVVVGGTAPALDRIAAAAPALGAARVVRLGVHIASHTPRLAAACGPFGAALRSARVARRLPPGVRLLSGVDGAPVFGIAEGMDKLAAQIAQTVRWAECLGSAMEDGASAVLELGPGRALSEMAAQSMPGLPTRSLDEFKSWDGVRAWLARIQSAA